MKTFSAPWSKSLFLITSLATVLLVGATIGLIRNGRGTPWWVALFPVILVGVTALFTIRGYSLTANAVLVRRLLWETRLPLTGLTSASYEPDAMRGSFRTFGNGGLFSFTGYFRNERLGAYRALVTDPRRTVVLRFPSRTLVLSPSEPEEFVQAIGARKPVN